MLTIAVHQNTIKNITILKFILRSVTATNLSAARRSWRRPAAIRPKLVITSDWETGYRLKAKNLSITFKNFG